MCGRVVELSETVGGGVGVGGGVCASGGCGTVSVDVETVRLCECVCVSVVWPGGFCVRDRYPWCPGAVWGRVRGTVLLTVHRRVCVEPV